MSLLPYTLNKAGDFIILNLGPYFNVEYINNFILNVSGSGGTLKSEFRYSYDSNTYSAYIDLTTSNLDFIIIKNDLPLFFQFKFTLLLGNNYIINNIDLDVTYKKIDKNFNKKPLLYLIESGNIFSISKINEFSFRPYNVNEAAILYDELNYIVNTTFGHDVEYFRSLPDNRGQDLSLLEYTLYNVQPSKCIKVVVPNNEFPDAKYNFNPFGIDFERPFEIQIVKSYWEEYFGVGSGPQRRDIIYFPLTRRIYEVNSTYLFRGFMERDSYWKIDLIKYQPRSNRSEPDEIRTSLDNISADVEEIFGSEQESERQKITNQQQFNPYIGIDNKDPIRNFVNENTLIFEHNLMNYSNKISEYYYDSSKIFQYDLTKNHFVEYKKDAYINENEDRSYAAWFQIKTTSKSLPKDNIISMNLTGTTLNITIDKIRSYAIGQLLKIYRPGFIINFYGKILSSTTSGSNTIIQLNIEQDILNYLNSISSSWISLNNYKAEIAKENNFLYVYDETNQKGLKIDLIVDRYFKIYLNDKKYLFILNKNLNVEYWYGIVVNISNQFKQLNLNLWDMLYNENDANSPKTNDLNNVYNFTYNNIDEFKFNLNDKYKILASELNLTNIRYFNNIIEFEKQKIILNQNIIKDADKAIIIDNALPLFKLPYIGKAK